MRTRKCTSGRRPPGRCAAAAALALVLAGGAASQTCLTTLFQSNNNCGPGSTIFFDLVVASPIQIVAFDTNYSSVGSSVGLTVYTTPGTSVGKERTRGAWTQAGVDDGTAISAGLNRPTRITLRTPFVLVPGSYGMALVADPAEPHFYTNNTSTYRDANLTLTLGSSICGVFSGSLFRSRVWNGSICYHLREGFAIWSTFGAGCGQAGPESFFEQFFTVGVGNPFDLNGKSFELRPAGAGYVVFPLASGRATPTTAPLPFQTDEVKRIPLPWLFPYSTGTTRHIWLSSNGWIAFSSTMAPEPLERATTLVSGPPRLCALWDSLDPAAGGTIHAERNPAVPSKFHVTFTGVPVRSPTGGTVDFQATLSSNGLINLQYGSPPVPAREGIVGYSPGGGVVSPGPVDLSAITVLRVGPPDLALSNVAGSRPVLGTTFQMEVRNIPSTSTFGLMLYGATAVVPGFDLTGIGAPGCLLSTSIATQVPFLPTGPTTSIRLPIPNRPRLSGGHVFAQGLLTGVQAVQPLTIGTTNGGDMKLGSN